MDTTKYQTIKEIDSENYQDFELNKHYLFNGWELITTRTRRVMDDDGGFVDYLIYTLGHETRDA